MKVVGLAVLAASASANCSIEFGRRQGMVVSLTDTGGVPSDTSSSSGGGLPCHITSNPQSAPVTGSACSWGVPTAVFDTVDDVLRWVSTFDANADALLCNAEVRSTPTTAAVFLPRFERMRVVGAPVMCLRHGMIEAWSSWHPRTQPRP